MGRLFAVQLWLAWLGPFELLVTACSTRTGALSCLHSQYLPRKCKHHTASQDLLHPTSGHFRTSFWNPDSKWHFSATPFTSSASSHLSMSAEGIGYYLVRESLLHHKEPYALSWCGSICPPTAFWPCDIYSGGRASVSLSHCPHESSL